MTRPYYIPAGYKRIKVVGSLTELFNEQFGGSDEVNCILLPRQLTGDFNALAAAIASVLPVVEDDKSLTDALESFSLAGRNEISLAAQQILEDIELVKKTGAAPYFRMVRPGDKSYEGQKYFHEDHISAETASVEMGLILSCYTKPTTRFIRNEDAAFKIDPMFYVPHNGAAQFEFRPGDIWRHAGAYVEGISTTRPFIHAAPEQKEGELPRLLLVGFAP